MRRGSWGAEPPTGPRARGSPLWPCRLAVLALTVVGGAVVPVGLAAQGPVDSLSARTVTVAPGAHYRAGGLHRTVFGSKYRDLWAMPIEVAVLDLASTAVGLTVLRRGGFGQTRSLHFRGGDGRRYLFRSVDKDPSQGLPADLRGTLVETVVQDMISAQHPYAALVVAPLLEAAGVLHVDPRLAVMPDDPRLGEYREEFAGRLGTFEERPDEGPGGSPGWRGFTRIVSTAGLFERLEEDPDDRVDATSYLAARLMDLYLGDRDRHTDQWRWARVEDRGRRRWLPIPRDRDQAFVALDGLIMTVIRVYRPQFVSYGPSYGNVFGAMYNGYQLDRRILGAVERSVWDSVAAAVAARLTDSVIAAAVRELPPAVYARNGAELERALRRRRGELPAQAARYYAILAQYVDLHGTGRDEVAEVERRDDGSVEVRFAVRRQRGDARPPYLRRRFLSSETREIRLYLQGGDDRVVVQGDVGRSITVRVMGGGGDDELVDSSRVRGNARTHFYDGRGENRFVVGPSTRVARDRLDSLPMEERFAPPPPPNAFARPADNWGSFRLPATWLGFDPDLGLTVGGGVIVYQYGFRREPYVYRLDARLAYATARHRPRARVDLEFPVLAPRVSGALRLRVSGIGLTRFYGFGNAAPADQPDDVFNVRQQVYELRPTLGVRVASGVQATLAVLGTLRHTADDPGTLLGNLGPRGIGTFGYLGVEAGLTLDARDDSVAARRGAVLRAYGRYAPPILSADAAFGSVGGDIAAYVTASGVPARPTLAVRVGAEKALGNFPFFAAAFLGGGATVRGFREYRFAGDAALYGNAELRVFVSPVRWIVNGEFWVFALGDVGRVYVAGESPGEWHGAVGGGLWFAPIHRANTLTLAVARSAERLGVFVRSGFMF